MFETRKELQSQLEASQAEVTRLEAELATATARVDESATLSQQVAELTEDLEACRAEVTAETEAHTATKELLTAEQAKTTPDAITKLVTAQLAQAGHPPIEDSASADTGSKTKYEEYRNLQETNPRAASAFWEKHADDIKSGN